jgi:hypothetical protein
MIDEPNRMIGRHSVSVGERRMRKFAIFTILIAVQFVELQQLVVGGRIEESLRPLGLDELVLVFYQLAW